MRPGSTPEHHAKLREVGFDDRGILQITLIASWFNYINRVADALGVGRDPGKASVQGLSPAPSRHQSAHGRACDIVTGTRSRQASGMRSGSFSDNSRDAMTATSSAGSRGFARCHW